MDQATIDPPPSPRRKNPWWIPPFLGRVPDVEPRLLSLLGFVALALLFENYDFSLLGAALKDIAEDLDIAEEHLGYFSSAIRFGALPAFFLIPLADRIGRRRLFLAAVVALSVGTCATGFSQSAVQFVVIQIFTRAALVVAGALAVVIVTEEFPAAHRGWGMGMLAAVASVGHGLGAALFALIDLLPFGWRALYAIGVFPVLLMPMFRRGISETKRFERHLASRDNSVSIGWFGPLIAMARQYPARSGIVISIGALSAVGPAVVFAFIGYFVRTVHGWAPWQYSVMVIACGAFGVFGNVIGGRMADRFGRRIVGFVMLASFPLFAWMFFRGPGWSLPIVWVALVLTTLASGVIARALATELFPTEQRGTSAGVMILAETAGAGIGLSILGMLSREQGDLVAMLPAVASITLIAGMLIWLLPETSRRELEAITRDDLVADAPLAPPLADVEQA